MRIIQLSDMHIFADRAARFSGVDTRASFQRVLRHAIDELGCDLLALSGDLSMDGSAESYAWLAAELEPLLPQQVLLAGNHDQPSAWPSASSGFIDTCLSVQHSKWQFDFLDTRVAGKEYGALGPHGCERLAATLSEGGEREHVIFMHHPPFLLGSAWLDAIGLQDAEDFWRVIDGHRVRAIICGHVHQHFDAYRGGVRLLTTPSTCVQFAPSLARYASDRRGPGLRVIELGEQGAFSTEVIRLEA